MRIFNVKEGIIDNRNFKHSDVSVLSISLPEKVSHRSNFIYKYDQKSRGTCYAFGAVNMIESRRVMLGLPRFRFSQMFLSYVTRLVESNGDSLNPEMYTDNGATVLSVMKALKKYGTVLDSQYPYKDDLAYFKQIPRLANSKIVTSDVSLSFNLMLNQAILNSIDKYYFMSSVQEIKDALSKGYDVGIGVDVFKEFMTLKKDDVYSGGSSFKGGHFVTLIGYDESKCAFEFVNSWGEDYCDSSFGWVSFDFISDMIVKYNACRISLINERNTLPSSLVKGINLLTSCVRKK
jgi:C1A family cysteine protease